MISVSDIKNAGYNAAVSDKMINKIKDWGDAYENRAFWLSNDEKNVCSLELPSGIASEITRLILYKGKSWITGKGSADSSPRSQWLQERYSKFMKGIHRELEAGCAVGGMVFKPYIVGNELHIDTIPNDRFIPCAFDLEENITEAVFLSSAVIGDRYYTRLEHHRWSPELTYKITNKVFVSGNADSLGTETNLSEVPQWSGVEAERSFSNIKQPLFSYFRLPAANNTDRNSAMGISCYARAMNQIRQADEQWERIMWEYHGSELAVMAESGMFRLVKGETDLPEGNKRLYRIFNEMKNSPFETFSPDIRDGSLFNGLNRIFQRIEFSCGLAYGTISDPQTVEKTAEEVRYSKQRSLTNIQNAQAALEDSLKQLIYAMNAYADIIGTVPGGEYETVFEWGDGVTEDRDKEFQRRIQLASAGKYKWELLIAWYFGVSEAKAAEMIPAVQSLFGGNNAVTI